MCREAQGCIDTIKNNRVRLGIENGWVPGYMQQAITLITPFSDVLHTLHVLQNLPPHSKKKKITTVMGETIEKSTE